MAKGRYASVEKKDCIACGTCMIVCPRDAVTIKEGYYAYAEAEKCVGCGICGKHCPTGCISVIDMKKDFVEEEAAGREVQR